MKVQVGLGWFRSVQVGLNQCWLGSFSWPVQVVEVNLGQFRLSLCWFMLVLFISVSLGQFRLFRSVSVSSGSVQVGLGWFNSFQLFWPVQVVQVNMGLNQVGFIQFRLVQVCFGQFKLVQVVQVSLGWFRLDFRWFRLLQSGLGLFQLLSAC